MIQMNPGQARFCPFCSLGPELLWYHTNVRPRYTTSVILGHACKHRMISEEQPEFVIDFLKRVPASWDETRFVDGYPGRFVVLARRAGPSWYIAATRAGKERRELSISVPWLRGQTLTLLHDQPDRTAGTRQVTVGNDGMVQLALESNGERSCTNPETQFSQFATTANRARIILLKPFEIQPNAYETP